MATATQPGQTDPETLLTLANGLRQSCFELGLSVASLAREPEDAVHDFCLDRLEQTCLLREEICRRAVALQERQAQVSELPPALQDELRVKVGESRRMLEEATGVYSKLTQKVAGACAEVGRELRKVCEGSRAMGGYRQATQVSRERAG